VYGNSAITTNSNHKTSNEPIIRVEGLSKDFVQDRKPLAVLHDVNFHALDGEFVSILGPSGCGKSTLLNIIAGLDEQSSGTLNLPNIPSEQRLGRVGHMHQNDLLLPWRSVIDNVILGLELQGVARLDAKRRAAKMLDVFGLKEFAGEYPHALSGGMRQRASFMRTVLADQEVFLLDEPFGALDALSRGQMQEWLLARWESMDKTIVLVTHDVDEAIFLSDRVYVMTARPGRMKLVEQIDLPRPRTPDMLTGTAFVAHKARLLGSIREERAELREAVPA
jgi:ABC-type nitrate/sulfonate/bicarbonate transport system ATPase subunit